VLVKGVVFDIASVFVLVVVSLLVGVGVKVIFRFSRVLVTVGLVDAEISITVGSADLLGTSVGVTVIVDNVIVFLILKSEALVSFLAQLTRTKKPTMINIIFFFIVDTYVELIL